MKDEEFKIYIDGFLAGLNSANDILEKKNLHINIPSREEIIKKYNESKK